MESKSGRVRERIGRIREYVEDERFERDLDTLAARLSLAGESYPKGGRTHWERCNAKARFILLKVGEDAVLLTTVTGLAGPIVPRVFRRALLPLGTTAALAVLAYHCYQVFVARGAQALSVSPDRRF